MLLKEYFVKDYLKTWGSLCLLSLPISQVWNFVGSTFLIRLSNKGLPVGFLLLWCSVLFTVESLSLLYLLVICWFICSRRWCIDKLGVFHANQISMCLDPHLNLGWGWRRETSLSPSVKYLTDGSKVVLLWIFYVFFSVLRLLCLCARLFIYALWSPAGKGLTSWLLCVVSNCEFVTFPWVSWVRCGTWLY